MSPTRRTAAALAVAALSALLIPAEVAGLVVAAIIVMAAIGAWSFRRPPAVERRLPTDVVRGTRTPFEIEVAAAGHRVRVRQPQTEDVRFTPSETEGSLSGELVASRRGHHEVPPVVTRTVGPLGLARWDHRHGGTVVVAAHADLPGARRIALAVQQGRFRDPGLRHGALGLGTDFDRIRDYAPDDDIRRMNWKATERTGRPMVNQYREDTERQVWCLIDTGRLLASPVGDRTRLDAALDAVAAVAAVADVVGDRVGAVVFDDRVRRVIDPKRASARDLVRAIEALEPTVLDTDHHGAFARIGSAKRALVLVFTDVLDVAAAGPLVEAVPVLVRRHAVVVAGVADPDLVEAVTASPTDRRDLLVASVAGDLLEERRLVDARLRAAGATIVDAPVDRFPSACVAAYLRLKSVARL